MDNIKITSVFVLLLATIQVHSQTESGKNNLSLLTLLEEEVTRGIEDSLFFEDPILIIEGIVVPYERREEALVNLYKKDILEIQSISHKKLLETLYHAKNGVVVITLIKKSGKRWSKYWKKME